MDILKLIGQIAACVVGGAVAIFAVVFLVSAMYATLWGPYGCEAFGEGMKVKTEWRFWYGCFVTMPNGEILPESIARDVLRQRYSVDVKAR